ncbi:MAG: preprotein translocase subunit SecE [Candidatus Gracilibacteria bacterium]|nr:preprotein translocase subunit SecE [Candidatus Gracilibacteria bacterium]
MLQFFKDSIRELKHVVWPTKEETTKYFIIVVTILVVFGIYLFLASTLFSEGLLALKKLFV